ncbi:DUF397 domain-containing protein [Saccharopolyspora gregorii]|uniref:DUF397 domain-containing protein n=1 Tax=Saccharopolyspora gregorii TaxID=33914 RepID=UPI0031F03321
MQEPQHGARRSQLSSARWRKSSYSNGSGGVCVEVATVAAGTGIRDSKLGAASPILAFEHGAFAKFLGAVKGGRLGGNGSRGQRPGRATFLRPLRCHSIPDDSPAPRSIRFDLASTCFVERIPTCSRRGTCRWMRSRS